MTEHHYVEDTVRPIPFWGMLILWTSCGYCIISSGAAFFCGPVPKWGLFETGDVETALFFGAITTLLLIVFTLVFVFFRGVRFRIYDDRIEYQKGRSPNFSETQILVFEELDAVLWEVREFGDDNPIDTSFIGFVFENRRSPFQLHKPYRFDSPVAEVCKRIERNVLLPEMLRRIDRGETVFFSVSKLHTRKSIRLDREGIAVGDQNRLKWAEIRSVRFSKGKKSGLKHYLGQSHVCIDHVNGDKLNFDVPARNPYAFWALLLRMAPKRIEILDAPKDATVE